MHLSGLRAALPGHTVRAVTLDDVPALLELARRVTTAALGEPDVTGAEVKDALGPPHLDLGSDTFVALASDGRAAAFGRAYDEHSGSATIDVHVDPGFDSVRFAAVADAAVPACVARVVESAGSRGTRGLHATARLYESETGMRQAYERSGFELESTYWRMQVVLTGETPVEVPVLPDGVRVGKVDPRDDATLAVVHDLLGDTFSEHHGIGDSQPSLDDFAAFVRTADRFDPESWWLARDGAGAIGVLIGDDRRRSADTGYIGRVGVRAQHRGRGVARALLLSSFADYQARGRTAVQLRVDSDNTTGATRLYESVGMAAVSTTIALGRRIDL